MTTKTQHPQAAAANGPRVVWITTPYHVEVTTREVEAGAHPPLGEIWHESREVAGAQVVARETINAAQAERRLEAARERLERALLLYGDPAGVAPGGVIKVPNATPGTQTS